MYNSDMPRRSDLPTTGQLLRSTFLALIAAMGLLVTVVLPSEYAIDPTGAGRWLGFTTMGEIKQQLAREAAADAQAKVPSASIAAAPTSPATSDPTTQARLDRIEAHLQQIASLLETRQVAVEPVTPAEPARSEPVTQAEPARSESPATDGQRTAALAEPNVTPAPVAPQWRDEVSFVLTPGQGIELKLVMDEGSEVHFEWTANGSVLNHDTHGDGSGRSVSYEKGRGVSDQAGVLRAAFSGNHGWFWRNRTNQPVTLTLRIRGEYLELKRTA